MYRADLPKVANPPKPFQGLKPQLHSCFRGDMSRKPPKTLSGIETLRDCFYLPREGRSRKPQNPFRD